MLGDGVVQSFPTSEAAPVELSKLGGWLRCTECTAALHFRCLDSKRQKDILKDVNAEREDAARKGSRPARWETLPADVVREDIPCMTCYNQPALCYLCGLDPVGRTARAADEIWGAESEDDVTELGDFARPVFRCRQCKRFAHYECLAEVYDGAPGSERAASLRAQLLEGWKCPDCFQWPEVEQVVAWRPASGKRVTTIRAMNYSERREKLDLYTREYLVKFRMMSWRSAAWVPHLWLAPCWPLALRTFLERRPSWVFAPDCVRYTPAIPEWTGARYRTTANMDKWELLVHNPAKPSEAYSEDKQRHTSQGLHGFAKNHKRGTAMHSSADARIPVLWKTPERVLDVFYRATIISSSRVAAATVRSTEESLSELGKRPIGLPPNHLDGLIHIAQLDGTRIISPADAEKSFSKVAWALVKWQGLEYEDASWIEVTPSGLKDADYAQQLTHAYSCHLNARDVLVRSSDPARLKKPVNGKADMDVLETINNRLGLAPYQRHAVEKMANHWTRNQTSILTDDAGMGKTVEITGLIAWLFNARQVSPFLILVPRHTIRHWLRTLRSMLPAINTVALQGLGNVLQEYEMFHSALPDINHVPGLTNLKAEVVIADPSEPSVAGARDIWARCWELLVIHPSVCGDEGSQVAALVKCPNRIILNDTLLTASELPGVLKAFYPIPSPRLCDDASRREEAVALEKSMTQAWIHNDRTKLLERSAMSVTELVVSTGFQASQRAVFQSYLNRHHDTLQELCSVEALSTPEETTESIRGALFDLFSVYQNTFLCADKEVNPQHVPNPTVDQLVKGSAKLLLLLQILRQLHRGGHRTVVVSPRTLDLDVIEEMVLEDHYRYMRIDRDSRPEEIDLCQRAWNQNGAVESVFLLHSHTFSADMNLVAADTVIVRPASPKRDTVSADTSSSPVLRSRLSANDRLAQSGVRLETQTKQGVLYLVHRSATILTYDWNFSVCWYSRS